MVSCNLLVNQDKAEVSINGGVGLEGPRTSTEAYCALGVSMYIKYTECPINPPTYLFNNSRLTKRALKHVVGVISSIF